ETVFPPGALRTRTPRRVADSTSTLSTPTPARPTTRNLTAAFSTSPVTFVLLRTTKAANSGMISISLSRLSFSCFETSSAPSRASSSIPRSAIASAMRTFNRVTTDVQRSIVTTQLYHYFDLGCLRKHVEGRDRFDLKSSLQIAQIARQRGRVARDINQ